MTGHILRNGRLIDGAGRIMAHADIRVTDDLTDIAALTRVVAVMKDAEWVRRA